MPAFAIMTIDRQRVAHCIPAAFFQPRSQPPKKAVFQAELSLDHRLLQTCKLTCKFKLNQQMALEFFFKNFCQKSRWPPLEKRLLFRPQLETALSYLCNDSRIVHYWLQFISSGSSLNWQIEFLINISTIRSELLDAFFHF